jgi:hypothetical protein
MKKALLLALVTFGGMGCAGVNRSATPGVESHYDDLHEITSVVPKMASAEGPGYYFYYEASKEGVGPLRAVFEVWDRDWVFTERIHILTEKGETFTVDVPSSDLDRKEADLGQGDIFRTERVDFAIDPAIAEAICAAQTVTVSFEGKSRAVRRVFEPIFLKTAKEVCERYAKAKLAAAPKS